MGWKILLHLGLKYCFDLICLPWLVYYNQIPIIFTWYGRAWLEVIQLSFQAGVYTQSQENRNIFCLSFGEECITMNMGLYIIWPFGHCKIKPICRFLMTPGHMTLILGRAPGKIHEEKLHFFWDFMTVRVKDGSPVILGDGLPVTLKANEFPQSDGTLY